MSNLVQIVDTKIDLDALIAFCTKPTVGAVSTFLGTTRNNFNGKAVIQLEYEVYEPMAIKEMEKICDQARDRWPDLTNLAIVHRINVVPVSEASVAIVASSPHRRESLEAVAWMIDELKAKVPIWKSEKYADGSSWKGNAECFFHGHHSHQQQNQNQQQSQHHHHHKHKREEEEASTEKQSPGGQEPQAQH